MTASASVVRALTDHCRQLGEQPLLEPLDPVMARAALCDAALVLRVLLRRADEMLALELEAPSRENESAARLLSGVVLEAAAAIVYGATVWDEAGPC